MTKTVNKNIFKRIEQKYLLTKAHYLALQDILNDYFEKDDYYQSSIYNLYFDNKNNDIIINSIEKPPYKDKIRLRSYLEPKRNDPVFLEIKKKYDGTVYKRRVCLTLEEWNNYYKKNIFPNHDFQIMKEIDYEIKYFKLKPSFFVAYDRLSYYAKDDENFRITFDNNLRSRKTDLRLKDTKENKHFFDDEYYIMETKSLYGLPLWFTKELVKNGIYPRSFSKLGNIYTKEGK